MYLIAHVPVSGSFFNVKHCSTAYNDYSVEFVV
jgi:hypothetical protein